MAVDLRDAFLARGERLPVRRAPRAERVKRRVVGGRNRSSAGTSIASAEQACPQRTIIAQSELAIGPFDATARRSSPFARAIRSE